MRCLAPHTRGNWQRIRADWTQQTSIDSGELEVWADAFFPGHLADLHIPGAVLIVVQNGAILLAKGYGNANVDAQTGMDPERMALRIGSVSKLFVATAVMQLVEQDRLDLHADVNRYLDTFQLGEDYADPVTLAHLLTHSYSNHGYALAAYIVERVSRLSFDRCVDEWILQPLSMDHTQYLLSASLLVLRPAS